MMKRVASLLLSVLLVLSVTCSLSESAGPEYVIPAGLKTVGARPDPSTLPADLPAAVTITSASFGSTITVELSAPVPSVSIVQYSDEGEPKILATAENTASVSADNADVSVGMADVFVTWNLSGGTLASFWSVWEDNSFDFLQCVYSAVLDSEQYKPYTRGSRVIEFDGRMNVIADNYTLENEIDRFSLVLEYDAAGDLATWECGWTLDSAGTGLTIQATAGGVPLMVAYNDASTRFTAVSDPLSSYAAGNSRVLESLLYDPDFIGALAGTYPQLPEPVQDNPLESAPATRTDLSGTGLDGYLWGLCFSEDGSGAVPYVTADPLFVVVNGSIVLNSEARDLNGARPEFPQMDFNLPSVELPVVQ